MANLRRLDRPDRKIPTADGLDAITRAAAAGTNVNYDPRAMSVDAPQIDVRGFLDEARGAAAVGKGIETVGSATMRLAEEQGKAVALNQKYEAENQLGMIETDLGTAIGAEPDELKHGDILNAHLERAQKEVLNKPRLGIAQQEVVAAHSRWATQQRHNVMINQARRSFGKAKENISGRYKRLIGDERFDEAQDLAKDPEVVKYMGDDWAASAEVQVQKEQEAAKERAILNSHLTEIKDDAAGWIERHPAESWEGEPDQYMKLKNLADARIGEVTSESVDTVVQEIAMGRITVPEEVEARALELPGLKPSLIEKLKVDIREFNKLASNKDKEANGDKNWLEAWKAARAWEGGTSDKAAEEYREMTKKVRFGVPDDQQGKIMEILYRKMGSQKEVEIGSETDRTIDTITEDMLNRGVFNDGKPMKIPDPKDPKKLIDAPGAMNRSAPIEGQLRIDVKNYLRAKPELNNPLDVPRVITQLLPEVVRKNLARVQDNLYRPPPVPAPGPRVTDDAPIPAPPMTPEDQQVKFQQEFDALNLPNNEGPRNDVMNYLFPVPAGTEIPPASDIPADPPFSDR